MMSRHTLRSRPQLWLVFSVALSLGGASGCTDSPSGLSEEIEELQNKCPTLKTEADCRAVDSIQDPDTGSTHSCSWSGWVPVSLSGEMCTFGEPHGSCFFQSVADGCAGGYGYSGAEGSVELATGEICFPSQTCDIDYGSGEVYEGPAECACLASPEYMAL